MSCFLCCTSPYCRLHWNDTLWIHKLKSCVAYLSAVDFVVGWITVLLINTFMLFCMCFSGFKRVFSRSIPRLHSLRFIPLHLSLFVALGYIFNIYLFIYISRTSSLPLWQLITLAFSLKRILSDGISNPTKNSSICCLLLSFRLLLGMTFENDYKKNICALIPLRGISFISPREFRPLLINFCHMERERWSLNLLWNCYFFRSLWTICFFCIAFVWKGFCRI